MTNTQNRITVQRLIAKYIKITLFTNNGTEKKMYKAIYKNISREIVVKNLIYLWVLPIRLLTLQDNAYNKRIEICIDTSVIKTIKESKNPTLSLSVPIANLKNIQNVSPPIKNRTRIAGIKIPHNIKSIILLLGTILPLFEPFRIPLFL